MQRTMPPGELYGERIMLRKPFAADAARIFELVNRDRARLGRNRARGLAPEISQERAEPAVRRGVAVQVRRLLQQIPPCKPENERGSSVPESGL